MNNRDKQFASKLTKIIENNINEIYKMKKSYVLDFILEKDFQHVESDDEPTENDVDRYIFPFFRYTNPIQYQEALINYSLPRSFGYTVQLTFLTSGAITTCVLCRLMHNGYRK